MRSFDVVVIGAGPAGEVAAGRLGDAGLETALVEEHLVGGECSYYACMPSKALLRPQEALDEVRRIPGAAEAVTGELDVQAVLDRRDEVVHDLDDDAQLPWVEDHHATLIRGHARVTGRNRVALEDGEEIEARRAVILATGSGTFLPPIDGLADAKPWTNREATTAKEVPGHLLILGGGVVGCEMAQAWRSLGAEITLVEGMRRLLPSQEQFACEQVTEALAARGVDIRTSRTGVGVRRDGDKVTMELDDGATVTGDELLVAVGRRPHSQELGLDAIGLEPGKPVPVDEHMRVAGHEDWLYAVGDVNGKVLLTHMGKYQGRIAADHITGKETALAHGADGRGSPQVIFTDPQVAAVGHTSDTAREAGLDVRIVEVGTSANAGGSFYGRNAPGTARILVDERRVIVGATITGSEIADFLHAATIAVVAEVPLDRLWHAVPCFPTRSELWLRLLEEYGL